MSSASSPVRKFQFPLYTTLVFHDHIHTEYPDGAVSLFYPPVGKSDFEAAAQEMGYSDSLRYGIEHDLTHAWLGMWSRRDSRVLRAEATQSWETVLAEDETRQWPNRCCDEEHLVNRMQQFIMKGRVDPILLAFLGSWEKLHEASRDLMTILRPHYFSALHPCEQTL